MRIKRTINYLWRIDGKIGIGFGLLAAIMAICILLYVEFREPISEEEITLPRILAARSVCSQIRSADAFQYLDTSWGQRVGGPSAWYSKFYRTSATFDEIDQFYKDRLPGLGFSGGYWVDSVRERHIHYEKDGISVLIAYRTRYAGDLEAARDFFFESVWNVYVHGEQNID
jgi:hypothetical protein